MITAEIKLIFAEGVRNQVIAQIIENAIKLAELIGAQEVVTDSWKLESVDILGNKTDMDLYAIHDSIERQLDITGKMKQIKDAIEAIEKGGE